MLCLSVCLSVCMCISKYISACVSKNVFNIIYSDLVPYLGIISGQEYKEAKADPATRLRGGFWVAYIYQWNWPSLPKPFRYFFLQFLHRGQAGISLCLQSLCDRNCGHSAFAWYTEAHTESRISNVLIRGRLQDVPFSWCSFTLFAAPHAVLALGVP